MSALPSSRGLVARGLFLCLLFSSFAEPGMAQDNGTVSTIPVESLPETAQTKGKEGSVKQLEAVQVTGSRVKRADIETETPVVTLTKKELERTGLTSIGDILQTLPSAGSAFNTTINNGGTGATEVDLRNLGSNRVLVLVDGHRWVSGLRSLSTNSVDLNTVPFEIIDRVDVLLDGASAIYGSDAITGVVNIITKKDFEGVALKAQYGSYTQGDGAETLISASAGKGFDFLPGGRTSIFANLSYKDQQPIFAGNRDLSFDPLFGTGLTRASTFLPEGRMLFVPDPSTVRSPNDIRNNAMACPSLARSVAEGQINGTETAPLPRPPPVMLPSQLDMLPANVNLCDLTHITNAMQGVTDYRQFQDPADRYNYTLTNYLSTPLQTTDGFVALSHELGSFARFSAQYLYSERKSKQQLAPQPICIGEICPIIGGFIPSTQIPDATGAVNPISYNQASYVTASSPFNPFGQVIGCTNTSRSVNPCTDNQNPTNDPNAAAGLYGTGAILRRMTEGDPRIQLQTVPTQMMRLGLDGRFDALQLPVEWEVGYSYGVSEQSQTLLNNYDMAKILLGTSNACATTAGCVPLNFLGGPGSFTRPMLDYVQIDEFSKTRQTQTDLYLNLSTTVPMEGLLAAPLGIAMGVERRTSHYKDSPALAAINNTTSGLTSKPTEGTVSSREYFLELQLPLIKDLPFAHELTVSLAGRLSDYKNIGISQNGKAGLAWRPIKSVLLRSTFSTSFRAPDVGNLFLANAGSYPALVDPCVVDPENNERNAGSNADRNCTADGVSNEITQVAVQILSPFVGNPNLKPETSHSFTGGIVLSPVSVQGLDLSVDYYRIRLDNFITAPGGQTILDNCYKVATGARRDCELIQRTSNGSLLQVTNVFQNFPRIVTSGVDYQLSYALPSKLIPALSELGKFKFVTSASFLSSYNIYETGPDGVSLRKDDSAGSTAGTLTNLGNLTRWKINPSLQWNRGSLSASWNTRVLWGVTETCDDGITPSLTSYGFCSDPNHLTQDGESEPRRRVKMGVKHDVQAAYTYKPSQASVTLGVRNVLDNDPPVCYSCTNSFDPSYWIPGVLPYLNLKKDF